MGISRQVSIVPLSVVSFLVAENPGIDDPSNPGLHRESVNVGKRIPTIEEIGAAVWRKPDFITVRLLH